MATRHFTGRIIVTCKNCNLRGTFEWVRNNAEREANIRALAPVFGVAPFVMRDPAWREADLLNAGCGCGRRLKVAELHASHRAEVVCNGVCTSAKGATCDCSCSGKNHGMAA